MRTNQSAVEVEAVVRPRTIQEREAVEAEREAIIKMLTDGSYCRYVDHAQDLCMCDEIAKDIRARNTEAV